jgi:hypothetical protein
MTLSRAKYLDLSQVPPELGEITNQGSRTTFCWRSRCPLLETLCRLKFSREFKWIPQEALPQNLIPQKILLLEIVLLLFGTVPP